MTRLICLLIFWFPSFLFSQEKMSGICHGKVTAELSNLEGIYVINMKSENAVITDKQGYFSIPAIEGDSILLSSSQFKSAKIKITSETFKSNLVLVKMKPIMNELREVIIKNSSISAESLGIIPYGQKKYTPAERKLLTATSGKLNPMGLDPLLNLLSGRTAMLKKELEVEKKESFLAQLEAMFDKNHYVNTLHIPAIYVKGFLYFVVENPQFTKVLKTKNRTSIEFLLGELATKYLEMNKENKS